MADLHYRLPYSRATLLAARRLWPRLHPALAAMRAMGSGPRPALSAAELDQRRERELGFWAGLPGAAQVRIRVGQRFDRKIAAAEGRAARAATVARIEAALDRAEAALAAPGTSSDHGEDPGRPA